MTIEIEESNPLISRRAELKIVNTANEESKFEDSQGRSQVAIKCNFKVLRGAGERNGETFQEYLNVPYGKDWSDLKLKKTTKAGQVIFSALQNEFNAEDDADALADRLPGKRFESAIGTSKNGEYSRITHDTIAPAPRRKPEPEPEPVEEPETKDNEEDWEDIPF